MMSIKRHIPNTITSMNLICGIIGVVFAFKARLDIAFYLMILSAVFDFLDGFAARLLGAYSEFGKELDSLADLISFGALPSVMLYSLMKICMFSETWICWIPLIIILFSALRLAKFNIDPHQTDGFLGLPTPACAMLCGSLCCYISYDPSCFLADWAAGPLFIPFLSVCMSALLVCRIPMFSLKFRKDDSQVLKIKRMALAFIVLAAIIVCLVCRLNWSLAIILIDVCYILKNIVYYIAKI